MFVEVSSASTPGLTDIKLTCMIDSRVFNFGESVHYDLHETTNVGGYFSSVGTCDAGSNAKCHFSPLFRVALLLRTTIIACSKAIPLDHMVTLPFSNTQDELPSR